MSHQNTKELREFSSKTDNNNKFSFIHSAQTKPKNKKEQKELEVCINTFRNLKALTD